MNPRFLVDLSPATTPLRHPLRRPVFSAANGGDPLLWQHVFWFFGHPEVYIIFVPALGIVSSIIITFSRRPVFGYTALVLSLIATGFIGFGLWVHHMFATGLPQLGLSFFTAASMAAHACLSWLLKLLVLAGCALTVACGRAPEAATRTGGDPETGKQLIRRYGCYSCHTIPGVRGADALVGPPLTRLGRRSIIAGHLPNTPENLMRWIRHPRQVSPDTAMPEMGVTEEDARHIAAYLYTLR